LCREAYLAGVRIMVDAEESWIQTVVDDFTYQMMALYNQQKPIVYITYQMYRHDRLEELKNAYQEAKTNHYKLGVKLVRGAYLEKEIDYAADNMIPKAIHKNKADTDKAYNDALHFIMKNINVIAICAGTHNEESTLLVTALMKEYEIKNNHPHVYFAQLLGMSDNISFNLSNLGYNTAKYVPYGPVESVMPYLMRRAKENSAIAGQTSRELSMIKAEIKRRKSAGVKVIPLSTKNIHPGNNNDFLYAQ
jgi:proline dehydrogenase